MKLCVTSTGNDLDAKVEEHFARAAYFLVVDTDTMAFEAVPNTARTAQRWSGSAAAQVVLESGVDAVLTGRIGHQAFEALRLGQVMAYEGASGEMTVREAVREFRERGY